VTRELKEGLEKKGELFHLSVPAVRLKGKISSIENSITENSQ
jgi:hypothetical protein